MTRGHGHRRMSAGRARRLRGLSLPGLLVGLGVGLVVVTMALSLVAAAVVDGRRLLQDARLRQDLRAALDIVARELRRAGQWPAAADGVWPADGRGAAQPNPYRHFLDVPCNASVAATPAPSPPPRAAHACHVTASADGLSTVRTGFHLSRGVLYAVIHGSAAQALTDPASTTVTAFDVVATGQAWSLSDHCVRACGATCPQVAVRSVVVTLSANVPGDPASSRTVQTQVRVRNDAVEGSCPAT